MTESIHNEEINSEKGKGKLLKTVGLLFLVAAVAVAAIGLKAVLSGDTSPAQLATFVAKQGPLTISVLESGTIKAREQVVIKNEVEGRTSIITLIAEGTVVKKGDLLIELDVSSLADAKIDQEIRVQNAEAAFINATETLAVVENQVESDIDVAVLASEFAKQDLDQYKEGQYPTEKKAAENEIALREEELTRAQEKLEWSQKLNDKNFLSTTELQADRLALTRARNNLDLANNSLKLLQNFTYQRNIKQLESDVRQSDRALERARRKARADVVQAEAELKAKEQEFNRQKDKLAKIKDQINKAKIYAPTDGMVIYATSARRGRRDNRTPLDDGVEVSEGQELIHLPTTSSAMAEVDIHESSLEKVRIGLPAIVTVDALPGKKFIGRVGKIAPLPDPQSMWMNPDLKVYNSEVYLDTEEPALRNGMSCKVEVVVEQYEDVVYVPVQAVIRVAGEPTVYVVDDDVKGGLFEGREVEIGMDNHRMVHIISGLDAGEVVLLTPPLSSAAIDPESQMMSPESPETEESLRRDIDEQIKRVNGTDSHDPGKPQENVTDLRRNEEPAGEERRNDYPSTGNQ